MPALLEIDNIRVQYGRFLAVDGISFSLGGGELLGFIGPNGAGKTTTLRAAAGLQSLSTGSVHVMGHDVFRHPARAAQHLGFTPDTPAVYDALTVEQFLRYIGDAYRVRGSLLRERIDHWLEALWLTEKRNERVGALSRGMRQRLAVARTLLPDPHVILLDEPAAGLDPAGRVQFRRLLASLRDQGKALIVSSHILADLAEVCTHIAIVGHGQLLRYGTVAQLTGEQGDGATCRYRVVLAHRISDAHQRLERIDGCIIHGPTDDVLTLEYASGREEAARLLAALVREGLPVADFRMITADLEQAYLRSGIGQVD